MTRLVCVGCNKQPHELPEYVEAAEELGWSPGDYVWSEEGTCNHLNGHFYCTECYINAGEPLGVAG